MGSKAADYVAVVTAFGVLVTSVIGEQDSETLRE